MQISELIQENKIKTIGRTYIKDFKLFMNFSGSGVKFCVKTNKLIIKLTGTRVDDENNRPYVSLLVNDNRKDYAIDNLDYAIELNLEDGNHIVEVLKRTESSVSFCMIKEIIAEEFIEFSDDKQMKIEFYGDSLTCGFGNLSECAEDPFSTKTESFLEGYAYKLSKALNAEYSAISVSGFPVYKSRWNEGFPIDSIPDMVSICDYSEDMTFDTTIPWDNKKYQPDLIVVNLGANDQSYFIEGMKWIDDLIQKYGDFELVQKDEIYLNEVNKLRNSITKFLDNLRKIYGKDIKIVWCLFEIYFEIGRLHEIIEEQVSNYDGNVYFYFVTFKTNVRGAGWHPGKVMHTEAKEQLEKFIKGKVLGEE